MLGYVWIYDNWPGSEYVSCNTEDEVFYNLMSTYWEMGIFKTLPKI